MKNSNDTIKNRIRDLPACSALPQPTAPPRDPGFIKLTYFKDFLKKVPVLYSVTCKYHYFEIGLSARTIYVYV